VVGALLVVVTSLALSACGGGSSSDASGHGPTSTSTAAASSSPSSSATAPGDGSGTTSNAGTANQHGGSGSTGTHGTTTTAPAATTTTLHNTIHPIPGSPVAPSINTNYTSATSDSPTTTDPYGRVEGECFGSPAMTEVSVTWETSNADFVQLNRGGTSYPPDGIDNHFEVECPDPNLFSQPEAEITVTAFGAGGEVSYVLYVSVDKHYH
jgi:hypothetical protein